MKNKIITSILPTVFSILILTIIGNSVHSIALAQSNSNDTSTNQTGKQQQERKHQQGQVGNQSSTPLG